MQTSRDAPTILLFCEVIEQLRNVIEQIDIERFSVNHVSTEKEFRDFLAEYNVDIIIADLILSRSKYIYQSMFLELLPRLKPQIKIIFVSRSAHLFDRLAAIRSGGDVFLDFPVRQHLLMENLEPFLDRNFRDPFRVLMIHSDDGKNNNALKPLIRNKQVTLKVIMKATDILDTLTSFSPEVVVLGNNITDCSPNEIAQVIEQQKLFLGIPIIFLMNDNTVPSEVQLSSFNHTFIKLEDMAEDKIKKLIETYASEFRLFCRQAVRDGLTGLLNPSMTRHCLEIELNRSQRLGSNLSFIMVDIDNFKEINDTFGHSFGDEVIKNLAQLLKDRLRKSDLVGRMGGDEFGIILCGTQASDALTILRDIKETFSKRVFKKNTVTFHCSFSAGISEYSGSRTSSNMIELSDKALLEAKAKGRNQVLAETHN